jgi:hypothetical protein
MPFTTKNSLNKKAFNKSLAFHSRFSSQTPLVTLSVNCKAIALKVVNKMQSPTAASK